VRRVLVALLDHIWDHWLAEALALMPESRLENGPVLDLGAALTPSQWVAWVTGLRPDQGYAAKLDAARQISVLPCPGLGQSFSLFEAGNETVVLYSPGRGEPAQGRHGSSLPLTELASFGQIMQALGDPTRLAIVLQLLGRGPLTMGELAGSLDVHQSTISRQVTALRRADLVSTDDERRVTVSRNLVRQAAEQLWKATGGTP
jgi:DNA-binding transcriptional ArsR family regulator